MGSNYRSRAAATLEHCSIPVRMPDDRTMANDSKLSALFGPGGITAGDHPTLAPLVTFLISTFNRREVLLRTLADLREVARRSGLITETIVIDNASADGTAAAVTARFGEVQLIQLDYNQGPCAKNHGLDHATGEVVLFLDDDSCPTVGSLRSMVEHFLAEPTLGAAVFNVQLPGGKAESSAYPSVAIGCGTGFRREALLEVGGLPTDFFMQAEEYDLSLRLLEARWEVRRFDDLHVRHLKTHVARVATRTTRLDVRNNIMVATRYLPRQWVLPFALDWTRRYFWIAKSNGRNHQIAALLGAVQGIARSLLPGHRRPVGLRAFEQFAGINHCHRRLDREVLGGRFKTVLLADVGKNALPIWLACRACGVQVVAVADTRLAGPGRRYRGLPVITDDEAAELMFDAVIVANASPVAGAATAIKWRLRTDRPVIDLFHQSTETVMPLRRAA
jgi:GT2 family glycosyltransferase